MLTLIAVWTLLTLACAVGLLLLLVVDERQAAATRPSRPAPALAPLPGAVPAQVTAPAIAVPVAA